jgi:hypothetical protein
MQPSVTVAMFRKSARAKRCSRIIASLSEIHAPQRESAVFAVRIFRGGAGSDNKVYPEQKTCGYDRGEALHWRPIVRKGDLQGYADSRCGSF